MNYDRFEWLYVKRSMLNIYHGYWHYNLQHLIWVVLAAPTSTRIFKMTVSNFRIKTSTYEKFIALVDFMVCIANNLRQAQLSTENISKATLSAPTSYVAMEKNIVLNIVGGQLGSQQSN